MGSGLVVSERKTNMNLEAKIIQWQSLSKNRKTSVEEFEEIHRESIRQAEEGRKAERIENYIKLVPFRFRGKTFADYEVENDYQGRAKQLAERYVETFHERLEAGTSFKFMGKIGTGKTLLALIIYQELAKSGYSVKYESSLEFIKDLLEIKFKSQANFQSHFEKYQNIQLLILDEVTESINKNGFPSELEKQLLFKIIDRRYEKKLCTLIITNHDRKELAARLGQSTTDRLDENGILLAFNWNSYRQK